MIKKREGAKINPQGGGCTVKWCSLGNNLVGMRMGLHLVDHETNYFESAVSKKEDM